MTVTRRNALLAGATALPTASLVLAAAARGQTPAQSGRQTLGEDPLLAACLLIGGRKQIEICRFILPKCQTEEVKALVQAEIDEQEKLKADLGKLGYTVPTPGGAAAPAAPQPGQPVQQTGAFVPAGNTLTVGRVQLTPGVSQFVTIESEVADTCIATAKQMLTKCEQSKGKAKMEKSVVIGLLMDHHGQQDRVTVFKKHATPELAPILERCEQACRQHVADGERILEKLEAARDDK